MEPKSPSAKARGMASEPAARRLKPKALARASEPERRALARIRRRARAKKRNPSRSRRRLREWRARAPIQPNQYAADAGEGGGIYKVMRARGDCGQTRPNRPRARHFRYLLSYGCGFRHASNHSPAASANAAVLEMNAGMAWIIETARRERPHGAKFKGFSSAIDEPLRQALDDSQRHQGALGGEIRHVVRALRTQVKRRLRRNHRRAQTRQLRQILQVDYA